MPPRWPPSATWRPECVRVMPVTDSDDWRVTISLGGQAQARQSSLAEVEEDIRRRVGRGIAVGAGDTQIFLYAGSEAEARDAERAALDVLARHDLHGESALHRWHPIEEQWEDPGVPVPQTEAERQAEHQRLEDAQTAESQATGIAEWQVRAELHSHHQAVQLARTLESEGHAVVRRWKFLVVGASNSDDAAELAEQIRQQAPPGATVTAEQSGVGWPFIPS
jgi:hypothetical protein